MATQYRVAEFAKLARITVRTLHYYDRIELLKPSHVTVSGHRLYQESDLVRLQQILTLKWMGFELKQIKALLDDPAYDLRKSLRLQQQAVDAQIRQLQEASQALENAVNIIERDGIEELDANTIQRIINGVANEDNAEIMQRYYTDVAAQVIQTRRLTMTPQDFQEVETAWRTLYDDFAAHQHLPPEHTQVQRLARRMHDLIQQFTGGHAEVESGLRRVNADMQFDTYTGQHTKAWGNEALRQFMQAAYDIYERNQKS